MRIRAINMPNDAVRRLQKELQELKDTIKGISTDIDWLKKIIIAAAGIGLVEKLFGWLMR